jgi:alkanesulfonate monooxygenase SsuD/methylene tetrahydromethanopterin reductase-like flavin-dependent oxidoreductase (luciferase family)
MINKFHVLYVGQIELDNIGRDGTPANDRRYASARRSEVFATARDVAQTMDELGFHALWTAEHHFQHEGYECLPNLIQLGLWLATQTRRLKFGCAFNVLPMWHPIRLAEDYAMADIVTDGRVIMGVGRGYHTREVETFGAPLIRCRGQPRLFQGAARAAAQMLQRGVVPPQGQVFRVPAAGRLSRLQAERDHLHPPAQAPATGEHATSCAGPSASFRSAARTYWW